MTLRDLLSLARTWPALGHANAVDTRPPSVDSAPSEGQSREVRKSSEARSVVTAVGPLSPGEGSSK